MKYSNESFQSEQKYCYQRIHNFVRHYHTIEIIWEKKLNIDVTVEVEKMCTILAYEKQDGYLACRKHLSKLMFLFDGDSYECDRKEFEFYFENKKNVYCRNYILY